MRFRWLSIGLLAACELLAGIGLRNEGLAARAQAESCRRRQMITEARILEHAAYISTFVAPHNVIARLEARAQLRAMLDVPEL